MSSTYVAFETDCGRIVAEIFTEKARLTAGNFLRYLDNGFYEGATFYRATRPKNDVHSYKIQIIQGGMGPEYKTTPALPPIEHEATTLTGLSHIDGALSATRWAPGTASSEFFIVIGTTPALDFGGTLNPDGQGYAMFGRVVEGMDVVRRINMSPTGTASTIEYLKNQSLVPAIKMRIARL